MAFAFAKYAWLHIGLTFPGAKKHIAPSAALKHPFSHPKVLVLIAVVFQICPVLIPLKMGLHLVFNIGQIGIDRK